jgi:hypothetical protein
MIQKARQNRKKRYGDDHESHRAQLLWSCFVAIAVVAAALYEISSPRPYLGRGLAVQAQANSYDRIPATSFDLAEPSKPNAAVSQ